MFKALLKVKPVGVTTSDITTEASAPPSDALKRTLTARHLIVMGVGGVIGAGIFVVTGQAAAAHAGPAIVISFVLAAIACAFAGLCYAEFAAMLPVSGSAYSYAYATMGEGVAWLIGWCLTLEYLFASSSVAVAWSAYTTGFLHSAFGIDFPAALTNGPYAWGEQGFYASGSMVNLPAMLIVAAISMLCFRGVQQSTTVNAIIVAVKMTVICLFVGYGAMHITPHNWVPFIPQNTGIWGEFGWSGVLRAGSIVFFAYIGFDAVSTAAGETKNPQRNMPIGILCTLVLCTVVYMIVSFVLTGIVPYTDLNTAKPVATALNFLHAPKAFSSLIDIGAIAGLSSVILIMIMGQVRITYTIARDGLLPEVFGKVHPRYGIPHYSTIVVGILAALLSGFLPLSVLGEMVSMGTLLAFTTVCIGVMVLRITNPSAPRPFRVPFYMIICPLGALFCTALFLMAFSDHWIFFISWIVLGAIIYFFYGIHHSRLAKTAT